VTISHAHQVVRGSDEGEALWFLGGLYTFRATNAETSLYTLVEVKGPKSLAIPIHVHEREDEGFYVARGEVTIWLGDEKRTLAAGGFAMAPSGVRHTFRLETPDATLLLLVSPGPAHEAMFREMGEPATTRSIPEPSAISPDPAELAKVAGRHGTQIVGPPPGG
jgi:quercetin dioxygenase-like cupin family protein